MSLGIFFDTNCFKNKSFLHDSQLERIIAHAQKYEMKLLISRVVCIEIENQRDREVKYVKSFLSKWRKIFENNANSDISDLRIEDYSPEKEIYEPLRGYGFEILGNVEDDIHQAIKSFYIGKKPSKKIRNSEDFGTPKKGEVKKFDSSYIDFDYKDNIIKDVFIWRSVIPFIFENDFSGLAIVTDNKDDFCDSVKKDRLHPELIADIGDDKGNNVTVFSSMQDFIDIHVKFIEKFDIELLEILRLEGLDYKGDDEYIYPTGVVSCSILSIIGLFEFEAKAKVIYVTESMDETKSAEEVIILDMRVSRNAEDHTYTIEYLDTYGEGT